MFTIAPAVFAGGFQLAIERPASATDPELKGAVLVVRTFGCHVPAAADLSGTAEGIVDGQRKTVPLEFKPTATGVYAVRQVWPSRGMWVLAITGSYGGITSSALVRLGANGEVAAADESMGARIPATIVQRKLTAREIDSALKAGGAAIIGQAPEGGIWESVRPHGSLVAILASVFLVAGCVGVAVRKGRGRIDS
jgi:hypothetical protein